MKRIILPILLLGVISLYAVQDTPQQGPQFSDKMREAREIKQKMIMIEREVIQGDPELKKLHEQIKALQNQLKEKLQQKLANDPEYQELKKKMEEIHQHYKERIKERKEDLGGVKQ